MLHSYFRAVRLRAPIEAWIKAQPADYKHPIEFQHWDFMEALLPVLTLFKRTSKYLEADEYPTGSKVLKKLWRLHKSLLQLHDEEPNAATGLAIKPFCRHLLVKFDELVKDPTLMWQWAFLAFMDPTGGSVCSGTVIACASVRAWSTRL